MIWAQIKVDSVAVDLVEPVGLHLDLGLDLHLDRDESPKRKRNPHQGAP